MDEFTLAALAIPSVLLLTLGIMSGWLGRKGAAGCIDFVTIKLNAAGVVAGALGQAGDGGRGELFDVDGRRLAATGRVHWRTGGQASGRGEASPSRTLLKSNRE
jgi:hypothetical protein